QKDGRIVVAGASGTSGGISSIFVARYLEDGTPDTGFDGDGFAEIQPGGNPGFAGGVAVQEDGKIVVAGSSGGPGDQDFTVVRLKADGSLDAGFDGDGVALTVFGADTSFAQGLALQPDGGIVAAGARQTSTVSQAVLVRYLADGSPDASFGSGGAVSTPIGLDGGVAAAVALQDNGSIVVAGTAQKGILDADSLLLRYLPNGDLDPDFAGAGLVTTDGGTNDHAAAVALQSDGKIVVEGQNDHDVILIRYEGDPPAPAPQPSSGGCDLIVR
ncbi:MAG TPA: hypothetical protein VFX30_11730, partial [bacterium]|nr:hypothetical protein [bacterium]